MSGFGSFPQRVPTSGRQRRRATGAIAVGLVLALTGLSGTAYATSEHGKSDNSNNKKTGTPAQASDAKKGGDAPAGNNGHIQIDEFVMDGGNGNDPHVACGFSVTFFGYDAGDQHATITLTPWAPTGGGKPFTVSTSWHVDHRTSGNQLDKNVPITPAEVTAAFQGVSPHKQGYHAKIDVHVTGSQGSDAKHHTLWIKPCAASSSATISTTTSMATTTTMAPTTTTAAGRHSNTGAAGAASPAKQSKVGAQGGSSGVMGKSASRGGSGAVAPATAATPVNRAATTAG